MNSDFAGIESRGGQQPRRQIIEQLGLLVDERNEFALACRQLAHLGESSRSGANGGERCLVLMGQRVEYRGAKLLGLTLRLDAAFVSEGAIAVEGDGNQRCDGIVGERAR